MRVIEIGAGERGEWAGRIAALEGGARYPLGRDHFRVDHGRDYFGFFDRLGEVHYYAAVEAGEVLAVGCGVVRRLPGDGAGGAEQEAWYICDLKVRPEARGRHIPLQMLGWAFPQGWLRCGRGYGISMIPDGGESRIPSIFRRFPLIPIAPVATLRLWSWDADTAARALPLVASHRGPLSLLSLRGTKDIVLESTGAPLPLWHVQHGPLAAPAALTTPAVPPPASTTMFCSPDPDPLTAALIASGFPPSASALVVAHRMPAFPWHSILTSDI